MPRIVRTLPQVAGGRRRKPRATPCRRPIPMPMPMHHIPLAQVRHRVVAGQPLPFNVYRPTPPAAGTRPGACRRPSSCETLLERGTPGRPARAARAGAAGRRQAAARGRCPALWRETHGARRRGAARSRRPRPSAARSTKPPQPVACADRPRPRPGDLPGPAPGGQRARPVRPEPLGARAIVGPAGRRSAWAGRQPTCSAPSRPR